MLEWFSMWSEWFLSFILFKKYCHAFLKYLCLALAIATRFPSCLFSFVFPIFLIVRYIDCNFILYFFFIFKNCWVGVLENIQLHLSQERHYWDTVFDFPCMSYEISFYIDEVLWLQIKVYADPETFNLMGKSNSVSIFMLQILP